MNPAGVLPVRRVGRTRAGKPAGPAIGAVVLGGDLQAQGFEIGVHGLYYDGRDLKSARTLDKRLPDMRSYAHRWQAMGFGAPSPQRAWDLMARLGFDYDTSYPDTDPFEPQPGGCCTWLPYLNRSIVELPITLPQNHTRFEILRWRDVRLWLQKADQVRAHGGMVLALTHPGYLQWPLTNAYRRLLGWAEGDATAWQALPREVSAWWRHRAASSLERRDGVWRVVGRAAGDAAVRFATAQQPDGAVASAEVK
jgi:hypothetical protein